MLRALVLERMLALFAIAQVIHIVRWRWRRPSGYLLWFFKVWIVVPALCIAAWLVGLAYAAQRIDWDNAIAWFGAFVGYSALCGAYVMIYPGISELSSPSLEILRELHNAPDCAMPVAAVRILPLSGAESVRHRIAGLQASGLVDLRDGFLTVTPKGRRIAAVLNAYRAMLGIAPGAGG
jgi:hypothetical protein